MNRNCFSELQKPRFFSVLILTLINVDIVIFYKYMGLKSNVKKYNLHQQTAQTLTAVDTG